MVKSRKKSTAGSKRIKEKKDHDPDALSDLEFINSPKNPITKGAIDLLVQIVRGELIHFEDDEIRPASLAQRISAAQALLKLRAENASDKESVMNHPANNIDIPPRAKTFEEWMQRHQKHSVGAE